MGSSGSERRGSGLNSTGRVARNQRESVEWRGQREDKDELFKWGEGLSKEGGINGSVLFQVNTNGNSIALWLNMLTNVISAPSVSGSLNCSLGRLKGSG